ncbi:efflux RND transporter periplasmic adaptor subunit [Planctomycetaceae bacterium SH139]
MSSATPKRIIWKRLLFIPPVLLGIGILIFAAHLRTGAERVPKEEVSRALRVIQVARIPFVPRAIGYGNSRPARTWEAVAEVKGRITELNPQLKPGEFVSAGSTLLRIDETDIKIAIARLEAEIERANASLAELEVNEQNYQAAIALEEESLAVVESDLSRSKLLATKNATSAAEVDSVRRSVILQRQIVQSVKTKLNLIPVQIVSAKANIRSANANLDEKRRDLERCTIVAPFDCRIGPVDLEEGQYLAVGERLFVAQTTDRFEIEAQIPVPQLRRLFNDTLRRDDRAQSLDDNERSVTRYFDVQVAVRYSVTGEEHQRSGTLVRIREELDRQTRDGSVVVAIENPVNSNDDGPPSLNGSMCEVELRGSVVADAIVIPLSALHDDHVFVLDADSRLQRRGVNVDQTQSDCVVLRSGLNVGDTLVVSDPTPAIVGQLIRAETDQSLAATLRREASGEERLR